MATRPTSDRLRETLFNILAPRIEEARLLDLYAGSGAVALEALSRGAARVELVEKALPALKVLRQNFAKLGIHRGFHVHEGTVHAVLRRLVQRAARPQPQLEGAAGEKPSLSAHGFDLVFLDPPYDAEAEYAETLAQLGGSASVLLAPDALVIAEHRRQQKLEDRYGNLARSRLHEQGDAALSFYVLHSAK